MNMNDQIMIVYVVDSRRWCKLVLSGRVINRIDRRLNHLGLDSYNGMYLGILVDADAAAGVLDFYDDLM